MNLQTMTKTPTASRLRGHDGMILLAVTLSFVASVSLWFSGDTAAGFYVGLWVPSILGFGCYLKLSAGGRK